MWDFLSSESLVSSVTAVSAGEATRSAWALFHRTGLVHNDRTTAEVLAIPHINGGLGSRIVGHLNETESFGSARHFVHDDRRGLNIAGLLKRLTEF